MKKKLLIGFVSFFAFLLIISIIAVATTPTEQPPETSSPATTESTPSPEVTNGEEQALTPAEEAYLSTSIDQIGTMVEALSELSGLLSNPNFFSEDWIWETATQLVIIQTVYYRAIELDAPDSLADFHYKYVQAMEHYYMMTELLTAGIDQLDSDLIEEATAEMEAGTQLISEATQLMEEFNERHGR